VLVIVAVLGLAGVRGTEPSVRLVAVGDVLLDRGVAAVAAQDGWGSILGRVGDLLGTADIAYANLECPVTHRYDPVPKKARFRAEPVALQSVRDAGFDVLDLANNHSTDCGRPGLVDTMRWLRRNHLRWCGAGATMAEAESPTVVAAGNLRVAFVSFSDWLPEGLFPLEDRPTIALASPEAVARAAKRAASDADVVVVGFHWGIEFGSTPTPRQRELAQAAVGAGAALVVGHHPHVLQGLEWMPGPNDRPALVAYSLGNFVFDQYRNGSANGALLECTLTRNGAEEARLVPIRITHCRPALADGNEARQILSHLNRLSAGRGTAVWPDGVVARQQRDRRGTGR